MAFRAVGLREHFEAVVTAEGHQRAQAVAGADAARAWSDSAPAPERAVYMGDARSTSRPAGPRAWPRPPSPGASSRRRRSRPPRPTSRSRRPPRSPTCASTAGARRPAPTRRATMTRAGRRARRRWRRRRRRAADLRREIERHAHLYYVLDRPEIGDADYDALLRELQEHRGRVPRAAHTRLAHPARRRPAAREVRAVAPPAAHALAGQRAQRGRAARLGPAQPPPARGARARRRAPALRDRAQDRRPRHLARLPRRRLRARRDARQRRRRRGRDGQPAHHPRLPLRLRGSSAARRRRRWSRCAARSTCRWPASSA